MTNPFRLGRLASLLAHGEARKACHAEGLCVKAMAGAAKWLGTECSEGQTREAGRSARNKPVFIVRVGPLVAVRSVDAKSRLVEVRASIRALTRGNARRAKGRREMDA